MKLPRDVCGRAIREGDRLLCVDTDHWGIVKGGRIYRAGDYPDCGSYFTSIDGMVYTFRADRFLNIEKFLNGTL